MSPELTLREFTWAWARKGSFPLFFIWAMGLLGSPSCLAFQSPEAVVVYKLTSEEPAKQRSAKLATKFSEPLPSELVGAERFKAAAVRGDMLLTTYDCIHPLAEHQFFFKVGERLVEAKLWAADPWMNLAVLKSEQSLFAPFEVRDSRESMETLYEATRVAERGVKKELRVVSNRLRSAESANGEPQTLHGFGDLIGLRSIHPLPPGAPLLDADGTLRAIAPGAQRDSTTPDSLCIAIDSACVKAIEALVAGEPLSYGFLGFEPGNVSDLPNGQGRKGVYVRQVMQHSPAQVAGLHEENPRTGEVDLITSINGAPIESSQELLAAIGRLPFARP